MSDTDPLAGTTIGPDGRRVPVEEAAQEAQPGPTEDAETTIVGGGEAVTEPTQETAESVGHGTAADAVQTGDLPNPTADEAAEERAEGAEQATQEAAEQSEGA